MANNEQDKPKGPPKAAPVPAPPPSSRARLPSRLRGGSRETSGKANEPPVVGNPDVAAPPSHRHMATMGYQDTGAPLPTEADAASLPNRLRQTSLQSPSTLDGQKTAGVGISLTEVIDAATLDADASVALLIKVCQAVQQSRGANTTAGRLTPRHIRLVPDADGKIGVLASDAVPADVGYDVLYEPPEAGGLVQVRKRIASREDVYALGCIGFELFTGRPPFVGASPADIRNRRARFAVPAARQVAADAELVPAVEVQIQKALKKRSGDRHADAAEFAAGLKSANAADDRSTMALGAEQAELLQELLASKTANVQAGRALAEEKKRLAADRKDAEQAEVLAAKRTAEAEAARKKAAAELVRAAAATSKAKEATEDAETKGKTGLILGVLALVLVAGSLGGYVFLGLNSNPAPVPVVAVDAGSHVAVDSGPEDTGPEDAGPEDAGPEDTGPEDTGPEDTGAVDTGPEDGGVVDAGLSNVGTVKHHRHPKRRPKPRSKPRPRIRPKTKPKPTNGPVVF